MARDERYQPKSGPPRSLIDKLGVRSGAKVSVLGVADREFWRQLRSRTREVVAGRAAAGSDVIVFGASRPSDLRRLRALQRAVKRDGAIWVVTPKRTERLKDVDVIAAGKGVELVDNKIAAFSETHTAMRLVVPKGKR